MEPIEPHGCQYAAWVQVPVGPATVCEPGETYEPPASLDCSTKSAKRSGTRHYSHRTEAAYVTSLLARPKLVEGLILFHGRRHPAEMGQRQLSVLACEAPLRVWPGGSVER